ncbi:Kinesin-like protein kip2 [Tieghemiomyces parasiticus]|uniref:Kinesin-like protein n=1 Tax=Tieghemiomyces parasiticus TaxID=78921 RepID=A0A9W8A8F2_9FUNG|nr:Kinesin-like protein kip2 [Tieghemiomyces parasiticus]
MQQTRLRSATGFSARASPYLNSNLTTKPPVKTENVLVSVRVRPPNAFELENATLYPTWDIDPFANRIAVAAEFSERMKKPGTEFYFDQLLDGSDNRAIYEQSVSDVVRSAMDGYNGTVFAYGQTASGKTYTMTGTPAQPGVIPQTVEEVFDYIRISSDRREYLLRVSYLEIYNETIRDLLSPDTADLRIHDDKKRGVYVSPLKEEVVTTPQQVYRILKAGEANRHIGATDFNAHSSRSHSIFQLIIESREHSGLGIGTPMRFRSNSQPARESGVRISQLNLIDLAGSEKASGSVERRKEGAFINRSLLTLGTVIAKLTEDKSVHIPFRDSKLTRILQSSLAGHARVSVICTVSPAAVNYDETMNTLKFASRVKRVTIRAETHSILDDKALLQKYRMEILELKNKLMQVNQTIDRDNELASLRQANMKYEEEIMENQLARTALKERLDHLTKMILTSSSFNSKALISYSPKAAQTPVSLTAEGDEEIAVMRQRLAAQDDEIRLLKHRIVELQCMQNQTLTPKPSPTLEPDQPPTRSPEIEQMACTIAEQRTRIESLQAELNRARTGGVDAQPQSPTASDSQRLRTSHSRAMSPELGTSPVQPPPQTAPGRFQWPPVAGMAGSSATSLTTSPVLRPNGEGGWSPYANDRGANSASATPRATSPIPPAPYLSPLARHTPLYQHFYAHSTPVQVSAVSEARVKDLKQQLSNEKKLHQNNAAQYRHKIAALEADIGLYKAEIDLMKKQLHQV